MVLKEYRLNRGFMQDHILYLMHVPWGHIKQRPHFIAEYLQKIYKINIFTLQHVSSSKDGLVSNTMPVGLKTLCAYNVPAFVNDFICARKIRHAIRDSRIVWLTSPRLYGFVKNLLTENHVVVYDCMDDALEFNDVKFNPKKYKQFRATEASLYNRSNIVFATSVFLRGKLFERYGVRDVTVVNNAVHLPKSATPEMLPESIESAFRGKTKKFVYIGTISNWFDFNVVLTSLDKFPDIEYILFGCQDTEIPRHERIKYLGPVEHQYVFPIMTKADVLIMPFAVNDLVLSVNPVKVYEYIVSGKPALVVKYGETEKFKEYVYLYETGADYLNAINEFKNNNFSPKKSEGDCKAFIEENTWESRTDVIVSSLKSKI